MDRDRIKEIVEAGPCPAGMDEKVLAFASGEMKNRDERIATLAHIALCDHCRYLYEDYPAIEEAVNDTYPSAEAAEIGLTIDGDFLFPAAAFLSERPVAGVLGKEKSGVAAFTVPLGKGTSSITAIRSRGGVDLEIRHGDPAARFYLVGATGYAMEHPSDGVVRFHNVRPGRYALSPELREFMFITIE